jgi:hypothetical protein
MSRAGQTYRELAALWYAAIGRIRIRLAQWVQVGEESSAGFRNRQQRTNFWDHAQSLALRARGQQVRQGGTSPVEARVRQRLVKALAVVDEHGTTGPRLIDDAGRLWGSVQSMLKMNLIPASPDGEALELACYALQLPMRNIRLLPPGKLGRTNLRERAEQSAELLITAMGKEIDDALLDRVTALILQLPNRAPTLPEARLLADAVNLDDIGVTGFVSRVIQLAIQGDGITQVIEGDEKRDQYGYWEARLKDGFHFEPIRQIARRRLERLRQVDRLLAEDLSGDMP